MKVNSLNVKFLKAKYYFVLGVDLPMVSLAWLSFLVDQIQPEQLAVVSNGENLPQPLCGIYAADTLPLFENAIAENQLRLLELLRKMAAKLVKPDSHEFPESELLLFNVNLQADYEKLKGLKP